MADVGALAGVTDRTVSNVLSGKVPVRPGTRDAVLQAVQTLGYQMNPSARSLRTGRTGFLTLALPDLTIDYFAELANAVLNEADRLGWSVTVQQTSTLRERELSLVSGAGRNFSDGLILLPHALDSRDRNLLVTDLPMVLLGERIFDGPVDHVTMSNVKAAQAATDHLLSMGRRRIAAVGPNPADTTTTAATLRLDGYRQALRDAGIDVDPGLIAPAVAWNEAHGVKAVDALVDHGVDFDAIFCFNDSLAFGVLHALRQRGIQVPHQVAVVGFDNVTATAYTSPPLTTIDSGVGVIAQTAVQRLIGRILGTLDGAPEVFVANFSLVRREST